MSEQSLMLETDFALDIDYKKSEGDPTRVFKAMIGLVNACNEIDKTLLSAMDVHLQPLIVMDGVEVHSLKGLFRTIVRFFPDDAILHLDPRPIVGQILLMGKKRIIDFTNDKDTITTIKELQPLVDELNSLTEQSQIRKLPAYSPVQPKALLVSISNISVALTVLEKEDKAMYFSKSGDSNFNPNFNLSPDAIEDLLAETVIPSESEMILRIKKPDYMGSSMWEFRHGQSALLANIDDKYWLEQFQKGQINVRPVDAIKALVKTTRKYDNSQDLIGEHHSIAKIIDILPGGEQLQLTEHTK